MNSKLSSTAQIRQLLTQAFDDPSLDAFCQDYFLTVYDRFGRGMRRDEKITLLLDHCQRISNGFDKLLRALREQFQGDETMLGEITGLVQPLKPSQSERVRPIEQQNVSLLETAPLVQFQIEQTVSEDPVGIAMPEPEPSNLRKKIMDILRDPVWQGIGGVVGLAAFVWGIYTFVITDLSATPTPTSTFNANLQQAIQVIADFNNGLQGWEPLKGYEDAALEIKPSDEAGYDAGALWGEFDFAGTQAQWPRATFYLTLPSGPEDWTSVEEVQFDARVLPETKGDIKATIVLQTGEKSCFNEHGEFQTVGQEWTVLKFRLDVKRYKNCNDPDNYNAALITRNQIIELALVFTPSPDDARLAGTLLIDNVRVVGQPQPQE